MSNVQKLKVKLLSDKARVPTYATPGSACFDIYTTGGGLMSNNGSHGSLTLSTGIAFDIPPGYYVAIYSRSGHGFNGDMNMRLANCVGIIDSDYKGEVKVKLTADHHHTSSNFAIQDGARIAQGILVKYDQVEFEVVEGIQDSGRGGFGSTGT